MNILRMISLVTERFNMDLSEAFTQIDSMELSSPKIMPSEMTDEELSNLRFTTFSKEDEEAIMAELKKRGLVLEIQSTSFRHVRASCQWSD